MSSLSASVSASASTPHRILAIIPARGGSKAIPMKNIKTFHGHPLIYWSIKHAKDSRYINRVIVSTDHPKIAAIARECGAEVPFMRPAEFAGDRSPDIEFMQHALDWLKTNEGYVPDLVVQLRPTSPIRMVEVIDDAIQIMLNQPQYTALRTVIPFEKSAFKMYIINDVNGNMTPQHDEDIARPTNETLIPLFKNIEGIEEPYNRCRQDLPQTYIHIGYLDITRPSTVMAGSMTGENIFPYVLSKSECHGIDTQDHFRRAESIKSVEVDITEVSDKPKRD